MKKKMVCMMLVLSMAVGLCACGEPKGENETKVETVDIDTAAEESQSDVPDWLYFPYTNFYCGYSCMLPGDYCMDAGAGMECWIDGIDLGEKVYVTHYSPDLGRQLETIDIEAYQSSKDIFDVLVPNFQNDGFIGVGFEIVDYSVEILETKIINGLEMTKFQGEINVKDAIANDGLIFTYPVVSYGIATEKTPVLLSCVDFSTISDGEVESTHEEWITKIDDIVATFEE